MFDDAAKDWETEKRKRRALRIAGVIRSRIKERGFKTAMEYGCGTGLVGFCLIDMFDALYFVDSSRGMIEKARERLSSMGLPGERAICSDLLTSEPQNLRVDCIFVSLALHHIRDTAGILTRLRSLLNEGGRLIVVDLDEEDGSFHEDFPDFDGHNGYNRSGLRQAALEAGLADVKVDTFYYDIRKGRTKDTPYSLFIMEAAV